MNWEGRRDVAVRIVIDHEDTADGYHEWITLGKRVRCNRLGIPNRRMWEARWTKWVCNSPACAAFAVVSDDGIRAMIEAEAMGENS